MIHTRSRIHGASRATTHAPRARSLHLLVLACALAAGCTSGDDDDGGNAFKVRATPWAVGGNTKIVISGSQIAWIADEATTGAGGTDLNGDGDMTDGAVAYVNAASLTNLDVAVAATDLAWVGNELYMAVSEAADGRDWNADTDMTDTVLVHWSSVTAMATFVDELSATSVVRLVAHGSQLLYPTADAVAGANASSLRTLDAADPLVPVDVMTTDAVGPLRPSILKLEEGLVFLGLSEVTEARDLNGDTDMTDTLVLALLDLRTAAAPLINVGLALAGTTAPLRAKLVAAADWQVGFLVDEADQGNTNLNDPALFAPTWQATQCIGFADSDTDDHVLHYLFFAAWAADAVANPPRNTGLVGADRIAIANGFIATITPESSSNGTLGEGTCDLNTDGDRNDRVVRWTQMVATPADPILPFNAAANIHALDDVAGGTRGLAELQERFIIVVDEAQDGLDINGDTLMTFDLVGWLLPAAAPAAWQFVHSGSFVGASWMGETRDRSRLGLALQESVAGTSLNQGTSGAPGDADLLDSIPTFPVFTTATTLAFPGILIAVDPAQPGIVVARGLGFYRVSESADNRDWSLDGQLNDRVMFRSSFTQGTTNINGISAALNRPAIEVDFEAATPVVAAFLTDEAMQTPTGFDINGDGDKMDLVLQYFLFE